MISPKGELNDPICSSTSIEIIPYLCKIDKLNLQTAKRQNRSLVHLFLLQCFWVLGCDVYYVLLCVDGVAGDESF